MTQLEHMIYIICIYSNKLYLYSLIIKTMKDFFELLAAMFVGVVLVLALPLLLINDVQTVNE